MEWILPNFWDISEKDYYKKFTFVIFFVGKLNINLENRTEDNKVDEYKVNSLS